METRLAQSLEEAPDNGRKRGSYQEFSAEERAVGAETFWWGFGTLFRRRRLILLVTFLAGVGSIIVSLLLPVWYRAETRVLLPESTGSALGLLETAIPGAASLLQGPGGEYTRYLSILTSRTLLNETVERFDLEAVYETHDDVDPRAEAIRKLTKNLEYEVALDFDYLSVAVLDQDPQRSANMANFVVDGLNRIHVQLTSSNARRTREYVETRRDDVLAELDSAQAALQAFQERHGVLDIETQGAAFFEALANLRAEMVQLEVQYGALRNQFGEENPQVQAARSRLVAAQASLDRFLEGQDDLMPVAMRNLPEVGRQYARLYQDVLIQSNILEVLQPILEQARFTEEKEAVAVQVVDPAIPPTRKAKPKRALIVIGATASVFMLCCFFILILTWWRENRTWVANRLSET